MTETTSKHLRDRIEEARIQLEDGRLDVLVGCLDVIDAVGERHPGSLRLGVVEGLGRWLALVLEDLAQGPVDIAIDELVHLPADLAQRRRIQIQGVQDVLRRTLDLADGLDARVARDAAVCVVGMATASVFLSDPDLVHATTLLDRVSDAERAARRAILVMDEIGSGETKLRAALQGVASPMQSTTEMMVQALTSRDDALVWRAWRRAGRGDGRIERAMIEAIALGIPQGHARKRLRVVAARADDVEVVR